MPGVRVDRLIQQADELAGTWTAQAGRPRDADLRRAVSAAYYALFHEITDLVIGWLAPDIPVPGRDHMRRFPTHGGIKKVCGWVQNPGAAPAKLHFAVPLAGIAATNPEIANAAQVFRDLQDRRHEADYDHTAHFLKSAVLTDIEEAETAIADLRGAVQTTEFQAFASLLVLCGGGRADG